MPPTSPNSNIPLDQEDKRKMLAAKKPDSDQLTQRREFFEAVKKKWGAKSAAIATRLGISIDYLYKLSNGNGAFSQAQIEELLLIEKIGIGERLDLKELGLLTWTDVVSDVFSNPALELVTIVSTRNMPITMSPTSSSMKAVVRDALEKESFRIAYVFPLNSKAATSYAKWMGELSSGTTSEVGGYVAAFFATADCLEETPDVSDDGILKNKKLPIPVFQIASNIMYARLRGEEEKVFIGIPVPSATARRLEALNNIPELQLPPALWSPLPTEDYNEVVGFIRKLIETYPWLNKTRKELPSDLKWFPNSNFILQSQPLQRPKEQGTANQ